MPEVVCRPHLLALRRTGKVQLADGSVVLVRALTAGEVWSWQDAYADDARRRTGEPAARLVLHGALAADGGAAMFEEADLPAILALPFDVVDAIAAAVLKLSGLDAASQKAREGN